MTGPSLTKAVLNLEHIVNRRTYEAIGAESNKGDMPDRFRISFRTRPRCWRGRAGRTVSSIVVAKLPWDIGQPAYPLNARPKKGILS